MRTTFLVLFSFAMYVGLRLFLADLGPGVLIDDAYITLRYVQNLVDHGSFTYHVGERIFGISTIAYPLLLAILKMLLPHTDLATLDIALNICLEFLCVVALVRLFQALRVGLVSSCVLALCVVWNPLLLSSSQGGMETPLFVLWLLLILVFVDESLLLASIFAGMALMTRPEGAIAVGLIGIMALLRRGPAAVFWILTAFVGAFVTFYLVGYGTLYPASVEVKHLISSKDPFHAFLYFVKAPALLIPLGTIPWPIRVVVVCLGAGYGMMRWPDRTKALAFGICVILLNFVLFSVANPPVWYWYPAPMLTVLAVFFFFGLYQTFVRVPWLTLCLCGLLLVLDVRWVFFTPGTLLDTYTHRVKAYRAIIVRLQDEDHLTPSDSIFTHEIGAVGYFSQAHIYDAVGLINPSLAHLGVVPQVAEGVDYGLATKAFLERTRPDFIILQKNLFGPDIHTWKAFHERYRLLFEVPDSAIDAHSGDIQVLQEQVLPKD